ncbi:hypothetical protein BRD20_08890 [Halobacteriales archaeon SW_8_65_20]|nr:MAG: hypothetical protein BRD20_08890 [Halobacteriales archaeon SW_8_65_20]
MRSRTSSAETGELLRSRLDARTDRAFSHLETVRDEQEPTDGQEAIWTTEGTDSITARIATLAGDAVERILFATRRPALVEAVLDALVDARDRGVAVVVVSADDEVRAIGTGAEISVGRVFIADGSTVLLSVLPTAAIPHVTQEAAFWSVDTGFAMIIAALIREQFD